MADRQRQLLPRPGALRELGPSPSELEVSEWVDQAVSLFAALHTANHARLRGLVGELVLIYATDQSDPLVRAWHSDPAERFDFAGASSSVVFTLEKNLVH